MAGVLASVGTTVYAANSTPKPVMPKLPPAPKLPDTKGMAATAQQADIQAKTAGGSILSNQRQNQQQIGDGASTVRKQLLGI